ncbi:MAG: thiamine pyrophosphate-binding protein, partial [Candidatus Dadabacteria bacterium]|nr:thiamine pyrophosphate-binding protein [Candidatus Dadabacteria bacterium]NIS08682.1 thiamine pyrophosphate-binding protein [Candidatus Dadabacteria bacterium]NIY23029.1 thiamine pyrophosphate-binding protein [Candidatus Dadabacteria bacterium]
MPTVTGGWLVAKTLKDLGVKHIFTLSGGHINPIYNACRQLGITLIDTHNEQGASMAADAYGRISRKPGVCLTTAGPGLTNAITGIAGSFLANSPCLYLSGRSGVEENDKLPLQEIDQRSMVTPVTKWARDIYDIKRIPEYLSIAYNKAVSGRPGPVYLGMSYEVLYPEIKRADAKVKYSPAPSNRIEPDPGSISRALELLTKAKKPVVIAGSGTWYSDCSAQLRQFIELTGIPVFTLNLGRGIISDENEYCMGAASPSAPNGFREITGGADLILMLGIRLSLYIGFGRTFNPKAKIIQVDIESDEIGRNRAADLGIVADSGKVLEKLIEEAGQQEVKFNYKKWFRNTMNIRNNAWKETARIRKSNKKPIHALRVIRALEDVMGEDGMIVIDGGDTQAFSDGTYNVREPGHYIKGGPLGCMGTGIPFGLGVKAANPEKSVALISGDGAFGMNFMEFETALRHNLPFVAVVCNDEGWGMTKHQMWISFGKKTPTVGVDLPFTPFHELANVLGGYGEMVTDPINL